MLSGTHSSLSTNAMPSYKATSAKYQNKAADMEKARDLYKNSVASPKAARLVAATELAQRAVNAGTSQQVQLKEKEFFSPNRTKVTAISAQNTHGTNSVQK